MLFFFHFLLLCSSFIAKIEKILCLIWNEWFRTLVTELMVCTYFFQSFGNAVESYCTFSCSFYFFFSSSINLKKSTKILYIYSKFLKNICVVEKEKEIKDFCRWFTIVLCIKSKSSQTHSRISMGNSFVREQNMIIIRDLSCIFYVDFSFLKPFISKSSKQKRRCQIFVISLNHRT